MQKKFNPQPGDKIICNNSEEFICCTLDFLKATGLATYLSNEYIFAYREAKDNHYFGYDWQYWNEDGTMWCDDFGYGVREVIPAESKKIVKEEESRYTLEEIKEAWDTSGWVTSVITWNTFRGNLVKNDAEYQEYLRLKAIYE